MSPQRQFHPGNWEESVLQARGTILVDFRGPWCSVPVLSGDWYARLVAAAGEAVLGTVNAQDHPELALRYRIIDLPTLIWFQDGRVTGACLGPDRYRRLMDLLLASGRGAHQGSSR